MILESLLVVLIFGVSVWYLAKPFVAAGIAITETPPEEKIRRDLSSKKDEVLSTLSDLMLDRKMKKISEEEYTHLFGESLHEGALIVERLDSLSKPEKK